jgi:hypothetical protein
MIVVEVISERSPQGVFVKYEDMIQAFSADRADHALNVRTLPWRPGFTENFGNAHDIHMLSKLVSVDSIPISQKIFRCGGERKCLQHLLRSPLRRRMGRDIEVNHTPAIMREHDENKQNFKPRVCTVKKSMEASCDTWLLRNVLHVCDGGFGFRSMYLATEA